MKAGFVVTSKGGARILATFTPGGFEGFFAAVEGLEMPKDLGRIEDIAADYHVSIVGPPITARPDPAQ
ncbi:MAG: hypothetical protein ACFB6R_02345 [Alphaproteobacteria bacterium]